MMKKLYSIVALVALGATVSAQSYYVLPAISAGFNPGNLPIAAEQPVAAASAILSSTSTDAWSTNQTIPFSFQFDGSYVSSYKVSNTGVLTFTTSAVAVPANPPAALPSSSVPDKSICAWGLNLSGGNDAVGSATYGVAPNRQHWVTYASASHTNFTGANQWTYWSIVLEEGTNAIYIVDQRTFDANGANVSLTVGVQVDGTDATQVTGSPSVMSTTTATSGNGSDPTDNTWYEFIEGTQPSNDAAVTEFSADEYVGIGVNVPIDIQVRNKGSLVLNNLTLNYSINGGAAVTDSKTGLALASGDFASLSHSTAFNPSSGGAYDIKVWVSSPNGSSDGNNSNDTAEVTVEAAQSVSRNILSEEFSSATCPPCKSWNDNVYNTALANYNQSGGDKLVIKYQVPIPTAGDPSRNADSDARRAYYGVNSAPTMLMNGTEVDYSGGTTWADAAADYAATETAELQIPAFVSISNAVADYDGQGSTSSITVKADVMSNIDMTGGNFRVQAVVLQKAYTYNAAPNNDFSYKHVMRKMLPDPNGTALNIAAGATQNLNVSYNSFTIGGAAEGNFNLWDHNIEVIIFVENTTNQRILNAQKANINLVGLDENFIEGLSVFPNPANDFIFISMDETSNFSAELMNMAGQTVLAKSHSQVEKVQLDVANLPAGVYLLKISKDGKTQTGKITIVE